MLSTCCAAAEEFSSATVKKSGVFDRIRAPTGREQSMKCEVLPTQDPKVYPNCISIVSLQ